MKVYVTKYALTEGIQVREVETSFTPTMVTERSGSGFICYHGEGREWHRTPEAAVARAEAMRAAKLRSLEKSRAKLLKAVFTVPLP